MAFSIAQKLKIKENAVIVTVNAPHSYKKSIGALPAGVKIVSNGNKIDQVHWFVQNKAQLEKELKKVLPLIKDNTICWIFYPKGSSKIQTDLTRDKGWEALLKHNMKWVSLIAFDDTWSAFGMRQKTEADKKKEEQPKQQPVFDYVNAHTKTVTLPADFGAVLKNKKELLHYFTMLAFTHKKEYVEWIVSAKKEETRRQRIAKAMEMLEKKWKNPSNR